jgi:four helix bundle protein
MRLGDSLPRSRSSNVIAHQLIKSGTSVGAHYREGARARSNAEVISKLEGALQELDETEYWIELLGDSGIVSAKKLEPLRKETNELIAILVTCVKKVKARPRR